MSPGVWANPFVISAVMLALSSVVGGMYLIWRAANEPVAEVAVDATTCTGKAAARAPLPPVKASASAIAVLQLGDGRMVEVDKSPIQIGRHSSDDIRLDDVRVSRHHAKIERASGGALEIHNLTAVRSEPNPMLINGDHRETAILHDGDVISLGGVALIFRSVPVHSGKAQL